MPNKATQKIQKNTLKLRVGTLNESYEIINVRLIEVEDLHDAKVKWADFVNNADYIRYIFGGEVIEGDDVIGVFSPNGRLWEPSDEGNEYNLRSTTDQEIILPPKEAKGVEKVIEGYLCRDGKYFNLFKLNGELKFSPAGGGLIWNITEEEVKENYTVVDQIPVVWEESVFDVDLQNITIGYHNPNVRWNGWATPAFSLERCEQLAKELEKDEYYSAVRVEGGYQLKDNDYEESWFSADIVIEVDGKLITVNQMFDGWCWESNESAYELGLAAHNFADDPDNKNPFKEGTKYHEQWQAGFDAAEQALNDAIKKSQ